MNKRSAKKYIQYRIADAIDLVSAASLNGGDESKMQKQIDELVGLYDTLIPEVNKVKRLDAGSVTRKHFTDIFTRMKKDIESITGKKQLKAK